MIRLFLPTEREFTTNGEVVVRPIKAKVSNADGGEFKLDLTCDISYSKYIVSNNIFNFF